MCSIQQREAPSTRLRASLSSLAPQPSIAKEPGSRSRALTYAARSDSDRPASPHHSRNCGRAPACGVDSRRWPECPSRGYQSFPELDGPATGARVDSSSIAVHKSHSPKDRGLRARSCCESRTRQRCGERDALHFSCHSQTVHLATTPSDIHSQRYSRCTRYADTHRNSIAGRRGSHVDDPIVSTGSGPAREKWNGWSYSRQNRQEKRYSRTLDDASPWESRDRSLGGFSEGLQRAHSRDNLGKRPTPINDQTHRSSKRFCQRSDKRGAPPYRSTSTHFQHSQLDSRPEHPSGRKLSNRVLDDPTNSHGDYWEAEVERERTPATVGKGTEARARFHGSSLYPTTSGSPTGHTRSDGALREEDRTAHDSPRWLDLSPGGSDNCFARVNETSPNSVVFNSAAVQDDICERGKGQVRQKTPDWCSGKMTSDDWRQLRCNALMGGSDIEKLSFKLLQEFILSPTAGLPVPVLQQASNALDTVPQSMTGGQAWVGVRDIPIELGAALSALSLTRPRGTVPSDYFVAVALDKQQRAKESKAGDACKAEEARGKAGVGEQTQNDAIFSLADNLMYAFEAGGGRLTDSATKLGSGRQIPVRGRTPDRNTLPRSMRERGAMPRFDDNVEFDPLFQTLVRAQVKRSSLQSRPFHYGLL